MNVIVTECAVLALLCIHCLLFVFRISGRKLLTQSKFDTLTAKTFQICNFNTSCSIFSGLMSHSIPAMTIPQDNPGHLLKKHSLPLGI